MNELQKHKETELITETPKYNEHFASIENNKVEEIAKYEESSTKTAEKKKKTLNMSSLLGSFLAVVVAGTMILTPNVFNEPEVIINLLSTTENSIIYDINLSEEIEETLDIEIYNGLYKKSIQFLNRAEGVFENLKPDTVYTLAVKGNLGLGTTTLVKKTIKTDSPAPVIPPEKLEDGKITNIQFVQVQRDLNREIKIVFDKNSINIPFPQVVLNQPLDFKAVKEKTRNEANAFVDEQKEVSKNVEEKF